MVVYQSATLPAPPENGERATARTVGLPNMKEFLVRSLIVVLSVTLVMCFFASTVYADHNWGGEQESVDSTQTLCVGDPLGVDEDPWDINDTGWIDDVGIDDPQYNDGGWDDLQTFLEGIYRWLLGY